MKEILLVCMIMLSVNKGGSPSEDSDTVLANRTSIERELGEEDEENP